jgi:hypothetical protein
VHGEWVIGTAVPASPGAGNGKRVRQVTKGPISAGRIGENFGSNRASREEAPEESVFSSATRFLHLLVRCGERSGTQEWSTQEGPRNTGRFWLRGTSVPDAGLERSNDQRTFGLRSRVDRSGSSKEGAVRWKATPELVSQDRERVFRSLWATGTRLRTPAYPSLGAVGAGSNAGPHFFCAERGDWIVRPAW